jgi:hypothetical protein
MLIRRQILLSLANLPYRVRSEKGRRMIYTPLTPILAAPYTTPRDYTRLLGVSLHAVDLVRRNTPKQPQLGSTVGSSSFRSSSLEEEPASLWLVIVADWLFSTLVQAGRAGCSCTDAMLVVFSYCLTLLCGVQPTTHVDSLRLLTCDTIRSASLICSWSRP